MTPPDVTAVVPTRDRVELLRTTLHSILWQRDVAMEVVVVDDGSSEDVGGVIRELGDGRIHVLRHEVPTGVSAARNHGAAEAAGTWLAFCDDDDLWAPDKIARQTAAAAATGARWSFGGAVHVNSSLRITSAKRPPAPEDLVASLPAWSTMPGGSSNAIVRRDAFDAAGGWDETLVNLADWDLWAKLAAIAGVPAVAGAPLVGYRIHAGNASADTALILRESSVLERRYGAIDRGRLHHYLAWVYLRSGRRRPAVRHLVHAAAHGQAPAVARVAAGLARRRVTRRGSATSRKAPNAAHERDPWIAEAETWISALRERSRTP
jgi:glycosyltransferase involved in cell wall biosynthesis